MGRFFPWEEEEAGDSLGWTSGAAGAPATPRCNPLQRLTRKQPGGNADDEEVEGEADAGAVGSPGGDDPMELATMYTFAVQANDGGVAHMQCRQV